MNNDTKPKTKRKGFIQTQNYMIRNNLLTPHELRVYQVLFSHHNKKKKNSIFPGQIRIAMEANCSERTVRNALKKLQELELVKWHRPGQGKTNVYSIRLESLRMKEASEKLELEIKQKVTNSRLVRTANGAVQERQEMPTNNNKNINTKSLLRNKGVSLPTLTVVTSNSLSNNHEEAKAGDSTETFVPVGSSSEAGGEALGRRGSMSKRLLRIATQAYNEYLADVLKVPVAEDDPTVQKASAVATLFYEMHQTMLGRAHPNRKDETLKNAFLKMYEFVHDSDVEGGKPVSLEYYQRMIKKYFEWVASEGKIARIEHFCNFEVMNNRWNETWDGKNYWQSH